jgi:hypothetical protein
MIALSMETGMWIYSWSPQIKSSEPIIPDMPNNLRLQIVKVIISILLLTNAQMAALRSF